MEEKKSSYEQLSHISNLKCISLYVSKNQGKLSAKSNSYENRIYYKLNELITHINSTIIKKYEKIDEYKRKLTVCGNGLDTLKDTVPEDRKE